MNNVVKLGLIPLLTMLVAGAACDLEDGSEPAPLPIAEELELAEVTAEEPLEVRTPEQVEVEDETVEGEACIGEYARIYEPGPDDLLEADALAEMPPEVRDDLPEDWQELEPIDGFTAAPDPAGTCEGAGIRQHCHTAYYGCATCFDGGQPRRRANRYTKWCWCENGQQVCGSCYYDYSFCLSC